MNVFNAIESRRAIKSYDTSVTIPEHDFEKMMQSVLLSPTSYNIQNWRFVRVTSTAKRNEIKDAAWGQSQVSDASELIILCANLDAWKEKPERYWMNADKSTQDILLPMIHDFYAEQTQKQRDEAMRSCGMAAQTLMLSVKALGYDSCPMVGFDPESVAKAINLPNNHVVCMMIAIGKANVDAYPRGGQLPLNEVLYTDHF